MRAHITGVRANGMALTGFARVPDQGGWHGSSRVLNTHPPHFGRAFAELKVCALCKQAHNMACCGTPTATYLQAQSCDTTTALYLLPGMSMRLGLVSRTIWKSLHITCKFSRGRVSAASSRDDVKPPPSPSLQEGLSHCGAHLFGGLSDPKRKGGNGEGMS